MNKLPFQIGALAALVICTGPGITGCAGMRAALTRPIVTDLTNAYMKQDDLALARDAAPMFIMLIEGLLEGNPQNGDLLLGGAQAYSAYASAFVTDDDEARGAILYGRARALAFAALSMRSAAFAEVKDAPHKEFIRCLATFGEEDVPALFWAASCWAGWIQANADSTDALADIAKVESLIAKVLELDETYYHGGAHVIMGVLNCLLPPALGGKPEEGRSHFERAIEISEGKLLAVYVLYASQYARAVYDRELHDRLLNEVIATPPDVAPELTLVNTVAVEDAKKLLTEAEDYFF